MFEITEELLTDIAQDNTYDDEPDKPELTGELSFEEPEQYDLFIDDQWEEGYDY